MPDPNITRNDLSRQIARGLGISHGEALRLLESFLAEITDCLSRGEGVKLSSFGSFLVREKAKRMGRNPKTGEAVPIAPRRVLTFKASQILKRNIARAAGLERQSKK